MTCAQAATLLMKMEKEFGAGICTPETMCVGLARVGRKDQLIQSGTLEEMSKMDMGAPLHTLVLCGHMHPEEQKWIDYYRIKQ